MKKRGKSPNEVINTDMEVSVFLPDRSLIVSKAKIRLLS